MSAITISVRSNCYALITSGVIDLYPINNKDMNR